MNTNHLTLDIGGMSCGSCVARVRKALEQLPQTRVDNVRVGSADIVAGPTVTDAVIRQTLTGAGYELTAARPLGVPPAVAVSAAPSARSTSGGCCGGGGQAHSGASPALERHSMSHRRR